MDNSEGESNQGTRSTDKEFTTPPQDPNSAHMSELLRLHQRLGHMPFAKLKQLAKQGSIPSYLAKTPTPVCAACTYAKLAKKAWRGKPTKDHVISTKATAPGSLVSVDQLVSPTPGYIAQMTGRLTTKRYKYATVFVDQYSRMGYVHIQKSPSAEETVEAKRAFETNMTSIGVSVRAYQADNGIFRAHKWVDACTQKGQTLTFVGVNAHHQNGHAERRIKELQESARTMMIHAAKRWPGGITTNLWPYAIRMASDIFNNSPSMQHIGFKSPLQVASGSEVQMNPKHHHTFGCPTYVLHSDLQQNKPFGKWLR